MRETDYSFSITDEDSVRFSRLSGDFNPLHLNSSYSRRLQYGATVVHGIHGVLCAIDRLFEKGIIDCPVSLQSLNVVFSSPVSTGQPVTCKARIDTAKKLIRLTVSSNFGRAISIKLSYLSNVDWFDSALPDVEFTSSEPQRMSLPLQTEVGGSIQLRLHQKSYAELFPNLSNCLSDIQVAQILASTHIVGMQCPGLNSIYSGLKIDFSTQAASKNDEALEYSIIKVDERFSQIKIAITGYAMKGRIDAFFRPEPVSQVDYQSVISRVERNEFSGQKALVIGGSRGIGETTAKILCAGGAAVSITYFRGFDDAKRVSEEINSRGGQCNHLMLDVTSSNADITHLLSNSGYSHIYYFATPHITVNPSPDWNSELFDDFCRFYVQGLSKLLNALGAFKSVSDSILYLFYPSTIYIDEPEKGLKEYTVAKSAGETLCKILAFESPTIAPYIPRLPRMNTDQTNAITKLDSEEPIDVMINELRVFALMAP